MPKVNIYDPSDTAIGTKNRRISVGWSKDQHAQLGVGWVDPETKPTDLIGNPDWDADFIVDGASDAEGLVWRSQWVELDRETINRLIRELRTARDQAFGKDE